MSIECIMRMLIEHQLLLSLWNPQVEKDGILHLDENKLPFGSKDA